MAGTESIGLMEPMLPSDGERRLEDLALDLATRASGLASQLPPGVKYEEVYLNAYDSVAKARCAIMRYLDWYNRFRPHSKIQRRTPNEAYTAMLPAVELAA